MDRHGRGQLTVDELLKSYCAVADPAVRSEECVASTHVFTGGLSTYRLEPEDAVMQLFACFERDAVIDLDAFEALCLDVSGEIEDDGEFEQLIR
jgi:hypothetical protein